MKIIKKILKLSDPYCEATNSVYPNLWYEFFCYIKAVLGTLFLIFGIFLAFHPLFYKINFFGVLETGLTPTGLKILSFLEPLIFPKGYLGFLIWGIISILIGILFFWKINEVCCFAIKLVKKLFRKDKEKR